MEWGDKNDTETTGRWDALKLRGTFFFYTFAVIMITGWGIGAIRGIIKPLGWEWD